MIQMANPVWLWGLAGLIIPIAVHLLSRKEGKIIPFGSIRFLMESTTTQFRSIRLNERWLLLLRCLMIILLVLFLGNFNLDTKPGTEKILVIDDGIAESPQIALLRDSLVNAGYMVKSTALAGSKNSGNDWSSVYYFSNRKHYDVVMVSDQSMERFSGERVSLPDHIRWISIDPEEEKFNILGVEQGNNTAWLRHGVSNGTVTQYHTEIVQSPMEATLREADTIRVSIESEDAFLQDKELLIAALKTLQTVTPHIIEIRDQPSPSSTKTDWTLQLLTSPQEKNKNTISFKQFVWPDLPLFVLDTTAILDGQHWFLTKRLNTTISLEHNLVIELGRILLDEYHSDIPYEPDRRTMPEHQLWSKRPVSNDGSFYEEEQKSSEWLFLLFLFTFVVERIMSIRKKQ